MKLQSALHEHTKDMKEKRLLMASWFKESFWLSTLLFLATGFVFGGVWGSASTNTACLIFALFVGFALKGTRRQDQLLTKLKLYERSRGSLLGFKLKDAFASDLEERFEVDKEPEETFQQICFLLEEVFQAKFSRCDLEGGEIVARVRQNSVIGDDACDLFLRIQQMGDKKTIVSLRTTTSAFATRSPCFLLHNAIYSAIEKPHEETRRNPPNISKFRCPLGLNKLARAVLLVLLPGTLAILSSAQTLYSTDVSNMLDAGKYDDVIAAFNNIPNAKYFCTSDKFVAFLGAKKYDEAMKEVDKNSEAELVAFALACQNKFDEADKTLAKIDLGNKSPDVKAFYLTKAMIAQSRGLSSQALEDLVIVDACFTATLHNLAAEQEIKLYNSLDRKKNAGIIDNQLQSTMQTAKDNLKGSPFWYIAYLSSLLSISFLYPFWCNKLKGTKKPNLPAPLLDEQNIHCQLGMQESFDQCLSVLSKNNCTVTNMDDELGVVEALDANGGHVRIDLKPEESGVSILLSSPLPARNRKQKDAQSTLRLALANMAG